MKSTIFTFGLRPTLLRLATLLWCLGLVACGARTGGGEAQTLPTQGEHDAFKAMILAQPELTEQELLAFIKTAESATAFQAEEAMDHLTANGIPQERAQYIILKLGLAMESLWAGQSYAALFPAIPPELYPGLFETGLTRKYYNQLSPLFLPTGAASGDQP